LASWSESDFNNVRGESIRFDGERADLAERQLLPILTAISRFPESGTVFDHGTNVSVDIFYFGEVKEINA